MTFFAACVWSLLRSLTVAVAGVGIASQLKNSLQAATGLRRRILWAMLLLPVFTPGLLIGYGYRNYSLSLVHAPLWNELAYTGLMLFLVVPVGTLILVCAPPSPLSESGLHVRRLTALGLPASTNFTSLQRRLSLAPYWLRFRLYSLVPAGAAMLLLTYQETEVAALMQARGWPEWMFTRLATGMSVSDALRYMMGPIMLQILILGTVIWLIRQSSPDRWSRLSKPDVFRLPHGATWGYLMSAAVCLLLIPGGFVLRGTFAGFTVLSAHPALLRQIGIALLFGVTAGLLAWMISGWIVKRLENHSGIVIAEILLVPGLMGAWPLGLLLSGLFQSSLLRPMYETPLPMVFGEVMLQLPRAFLIRLLLGRLRDSAAAHSAELLAAAPDGVRKRRAADLIWQFDTRGRIVGALLVCYWASLELTIPSSALLGPPGMTTAPVLLYNQMHYGQIPGLSALVFATIAVPVVSLIGLSLAARQLTIHLHTS